MEIDFNTALLAGYPIMATVIAVLWKDGKALREEYISSLTAAKERHHKSLSDMENRLAEIENANNQ